MYFELYERQRNAHQKLKSIYPGVILPGEDGIVPYPCWFLVTKLTLSRGAIEAMLSIYGLVEDIRPTEPGRSDFYIRFESDDQVDEVLRAGRRLNNAGQKIDCYRLHQAPC
jgi:hypothetical protein